MREVIAWEDPATDYAGPGAGEVDLWHVSLQQPAAVIATLARRLTPEEHARARRFYFQRDRRRYTVARGALRTLLGRALSMKPVSIAIGYTKFGKPHLLDPALQFNVSHAHELALIALAANRPVGIDLEYTLRRMEHAVDMAAGFFSRAENEVLLMLPPEQQQEAFFNGWTRKEAYIKALGEGLSHPLDSFDVTLRPGEPARFLRIGDDPSEAGRWTLNAFCPEPDYVAALAVPGKQAGFRTFRCSAAWLEMDQRAASLSYV